MLQAKYIHINMDKNKRPKLYTLPDTLQALQPAAVLIHPARPMLLPVLCSLSGCAGGWGLHLGGYTGSAEGGAGHARDKIFQRKRRFRDSSCQHPPYLYKSKPIRLCKSPKIPKNTKRPLSRS